MQQRKRIKNDIIFIILAIMLIVDNKARLDERGNQVLLLRAQIRETVQILSENQYCKASEREEQITGCRTIRNTDALVLTIAQRYVQSTSHKNLWRKGTLKLRYGSWILEAVLLILAVLLALEHDILQLYGSRFIRRKYYNILFMQDIDGRKRIAMLTT